MEARHFTHIFVILVGLLIVLFRWRLAQLSLRGYERVERWFGPTSIGDRARTYAILGGLLLLAGVAGLFGFFR